MPALFGQWPNHVLDAVGVSDGDRVLDVGCGTGVLARAAVERVDRTGRIAGIDPSDGMLAVARRLGPEVAWKTGVAEHLPYPEASFDRVVSQFEIPAGGEGRTWAHPVVSDGRLYLRHGDFLYAYDIRAN